MASVSSWVRGTFLLIAAASLLRSVPEAVAQKPAWPVVKERTFSKTIDLHAHSSISRFVFPNAKGDPTYVLGCFAGDDQATKSFGIIGTGGLLCIFQPYKKGRNVLEASEWSLLSDDDSAVRYSRGNFNADEIVGGCARHPEYGSKRTFRMRGFELTIELNPIEIDPRYHGGNIPDDWDGSDRRFYPIGRATLTATIKPDSSVRAAKPQPPKYDYPTGSPGACKTPVPNTKQPFCRDGDGRVVSCGADWLDKKWGWEK